MDFVTDRSRVIEGMRGFKGAKTPDAMPRGRTRAVRAARDPFHETGRHREPGERDRVYTTVHTPADDGVMAVPRKKGPGPVGKMTGVPRGGGFSDARGEYPGKN